MGNNIAKIGAGPALPEGVLEIHKPRFCDDHENWYSKASFFIALPMIHCQRPYLTRVNPMAKVMRENPAPEHNSVVAGRFPDGSLVKINGHTRCEIWQRGLVPMPDVLHVKVYDVRDKEAAGRLYDVFDSRHSVETTSEKLGGAARALGIEFESALLKGHKYNSILSAVCPPRTSELAMVREWKEELLALDKLNVNNKNVRHFFGAAFLLAHRAHGSGIVPFFVSFLERSGIKDERGMNAIEALTQWNDIEGKRVGDGNSVKNARAVTLGIFEAWWADNGVRFKNMKAVEKCRVDITDYKRKIYVPLTK